MPHEDKNTVIGTQAELATMKLVRLHTELSVTKVYAQGLYPQNFIECPFLHV